jgi:gas vesicle protein
MNQESNPSGYGSMLLTFLAGAAIGATVVALTTRKTGPQRLDDIKDLAYRARLKASSMADDAGEAWDDMKGRTTLAANDLKRGITDAANDLKGRTALAAEDLKRGVNDAARDLRG